MTGKRKQRDDNDTPDLDDSDGCTWRELTCFTSPQAPAVVSYRWCSERVTTQGKMTFTADKYRLHKLVVNDPRLQLLHSAVVQLDPFLREFEIREGEQHQARFLEMQSATLGSMRDVLTTRSGAGDDTSTSTDDTSDQNSNKPAGHYVLSTERIPFNRKGATSYTVALVCWLSVDFPRDDPSSRLDTAGQGLSCHLFNSRLSHAKGRGFRLDPYMPRTGVTFPEGVYVYVSPEFVMRKYNGPASTLPPRAPFPIPAWSHYYDSLQLQLKEKLQQKQQQQQQQQQQALQTVNMWGHRPSSPSPFDHTGHPLLETAQSGTLHQPSPRLTDAATAGGANTPSHPGSAVMDAGVGCHSPFHAGTTQPSPFSQAVAGGQVVFPHVPPTSLPTQMLQSGSEQLINNPQHPMFGSHGLPISHATTMPELGSMQGGGSGAAGAGGCKHSFTVVTGANFRIAPEEAQQHSSSGGVVGPFKQEPVDMHNDGAELSHMATPPAPWRNTSADVMLEALRLQPNMETNMQTSMQQSMQQKLQQSMQQKLQAPDVVLGARLDDLGDTLNELISHNSITAAGGWQAYQSPAYPSQHSAAAPMAPHSGVPAQMSQHGMKPQQLAAQHHGMQMPHSAAQQMPYSAAQQMPQHSSVQQMLPISAAQQMAMPHSAAQRMPHSMAQQMPHSAAQQMPHSAAAAAQQLHMEWSNMGLLPHEPPLQRQRTQQHQPLVDELPPIGYPGYVPGDPFLDFKLTNLLQSAWEEPPLPHQREAMSPIPSLALPQLALARSVPVPTRDSGMAGVQKQQQQQPHPTGLRASIWATVKWLMFGKTNRPPPPEPIDASCGIDSDDDEQIVYPHNWPPKDYPGYPPPPAEAASSESAGCTSNPFALAQAKSLPVTSCAPPHLTPRTQSELYPMNSIPPLATDAARCYSMNPPAASVSDPLPSHPLRSYSSMGLPEAQPPARTWSAGPQALEARPGVVVGPTVTFCKIDSPSGSPAAPNTPPAPASVPLRTTESCPYPTPTSSASTGASCAVMGVPTPRGAPPTPPQYMARGNGAFNGVSPEAAIPAAQAAAAHAVALAAAAQAAARTAALAAAASAVAVMGPAAAAEQLPQVAGAGVASSWIPAEDMRLPGLLPHNEVYPSEGEEESEESDTDTADDAEGDDADKDVDDAGKDESLPSIQEVAGEEGAEAANVEQLGNRLAASLQLQDQQHATAAAPAPTPPATV